MPTAASVPPRRLPVLYIIETLLKHIIHKLKETHNTEQKQQIILHFYAKIKKKKNKIASSFRKLIDKIAFKTKKSI